MAQKQLVCFVFAPHHDPLPRYALRGGGEEANDQVISEPFLSSRFIG